MNVGKFLKKQWSNILLVVLLLLIAIPQTGRPIKTFVHRIIAQSPKTLDKEDQVSINYSDWKLISLDGRTLNFKDQSGKPMIINFWATWCGPCLAEMPSLQALYNDYKDQVEFVFVSNEDQVVLRRFMSKTGYTFPIYTSLSPVPAEFESGTIPVTFLLDREGRILIHKTGAADWNSEKVRNLIDRL